MKTNFTAFGDIVKKKKPTTPPPAYEWQDLALHVIEELRIPNNKRSSVFKLCKEKSKDEVLRAMNDTKELCKAGEQWKYFFKVIMGKEEKKNE